MEEEERLRKDKDQQTEQHERVKGRVRDEVHVEIEQSAQQAGSSRSVDSVAGDLKTKAISDIYAVETDLARGKVMARISQVVNYIFYVLYGIIGLQIVLQLLGARERNPFKQFLNAVTTPFLAPFKGLMADPAIGSMQLMISYIIGLFVYFLLHLAVRGLLRLLAYKRATV